MKDSDKIFGCFGMFLALILMMVIGALVTLEVKVAQAVTLAVRYAGIDGAHHKDWVIDQMVRILTGCPTVEEKGVDCNGKPYTFDSLGESPEYLEVIRNAKFGEDGPETYEWEIGIAP